MASFTERYHELTKYNPHTIDKLGPVHWDSQPPAFKPISSKAKIDLLSRLQSAMGHLEKDEPIPDGPEAGLEALGPLHENSALATYALLPAVRGDLLERLGRNSEAREAFLEAASLTSNERERDELLRRATDADPLGRGRTS